MADSGRRPSSGPFNASAVESPGPGWTYDEQACVWLPPITDPLWYPACNCYTQVPSKSNAYGGTWCVYADSGQEYYDPSHYSIEYGHLPKSANPVHGQEWSKFTIWWAADFVNDVSFKYAQIMNIMNAIQVTMFCDKDQFWRWPNEGGVYNETPRQWYSIQLTQPRIGSGGSYNGTNKVASFGTEAMFKNGFLFPVYNWHGVIASCDLDNGYFHLRFINFHTTQIWDFDYNCGFNGDVLAGTPEAKLIFPSMDTWPTGSQNQCTWHGGVGFGSSSRSPSWRPWQPTGCMAQFGFHDDYMNLNDTANILKFFCNDGIKDVGRQAEDIWGVPVKFFSETSDATRNNGTLDFSDNGRFSYHHPGKDTALKPYIPPEGQPVGGGVKIGTCVAPNDYMDGLFYGYTPQYPYSNPSAIMPVISTSNAHLDEATYPLTGFYPNDWHYTMGGMYGNGNDMGWSALFAEGFNGTYALYARSEDPAWFPLGGDTDNNWKGSWSPLAGSFAPSEGDDPWQMVIIFNMWARPSITADQAFFCLGDSYIGGGNGDGYTVTWISQTDGSHPKEFKVSIPDGAGSQQDIYSGDQVEKGEWSCLQIRYDPDAMQLGIKVNGNAWSYTALTHKIKKPSAGAFMGGHWSNGSLITGLTTGCRINKFLFYHGLKTDLESDGYWNSGRMIYVDSSDDNIKEADPTPSYNPAMTTINVGDATGMFKCGQTVTTQNFTMIARVFIPFEMNGVSGMTSPALMYRSYGLANHYLTFYLGSNSAYWTMRNGGNVNGNAIATTGYDDLDLPGTFGLYRNTASEGHEFGACYMNVLMSYGPTASHFYLWNQTRGWMVDKTPAPGGAASALTPLLNNYSTLGGYGSGSGGKEMHLGYFGYSNIYTDFSQAANRDKFFDPVTGFAQELDESGWTEWGGVQPYVWSPDGNLTSHLGSHPAWSLYGSAHALGTAPITLNEIVRQNVPT